MPPDYYLASGDWALFVLAEESFRCVLFALVLLFLFFLGLTFDFIANGAVSEGVEISGAAAFVFVSTVDGAGESGDSRTPIAVSDPPTRSRLGTEGTSSEMAVVSGLEIPFTRGTSPRGVDGEGCIGTVSILELDSSRRLETKGVEGAAVVGDSR